VFHLFCSFPENTDALLGNSFYRECILNYSRNSGLIICPTFHRRLCGDLCPRITTNQDATEMYIPVALVEFRKLGSNMVERIQTIRSWKRRGSKTYIPAVPRTRAFDGSCLNGAQLLERVCPPGYRVRFEWGPIILELSSTMRYYWLPPEDL